MYTPGKFLDGIAVAPKLAQGHGRVSKVKDSDDAVDAAYRYRHVPVFVPVVREKFGGGIGRDGDLDLRLGEAAGWEMVSGVKDAELRVGGDGGDEVWVVGRELSRVGARICGEGLERAGGAGGPLGDVKGLPHYGGGGLPA